MTPPHSTHNYQNRMQSLNRNFSKSKLQSKVRIVKSVFSLVEPKGLIKVFFEVLPLIVIYSTGKSRVTPRLRHLAKFIRLIVLTCVDHGPLYTVKYMASCQVALQHAIAGRPLKSLRILEPTFPFPRLIKGIPSFIGSMDRKAILCGNPSTIRLWMSILNLFRVIETPRKINLESITDGYKGSWAAIGGLVPSIISTCNLVRTQHKSLFDINRLTAKNLRASSSAGPNSGHAVWGVLLDAFALFKDSKLVEAWHAYASSTGSWEMINLLSKAKGAYDYMRRREVEAWNHAFRTGELSKFNMISMLPDYPEQFLDYEVNMRKDRRVVTKVTEPGDAHLCYPGKLVGIPEPAGKMRIIALCDIWTQSLLDPLHQELFRFLKRLPNDGTFDQDRAFSRAVSKSLVAPDGVYCADLSKATDRLPIKIQGLILDHLFGHSIGSHWVKLFEERDFILREPMGEYQANTIVRYGAGQPMGCLSSWAMLAVTHHFILQHCYHMLGFSKHVWHDGYEILGDDIVIFDKNVYAEYLSIMERLNVPINKSKSLISDKPGIRVVEFAKRTSLNGVDVSPLSWKQFIQLSTFKGIVPLMIQLMNRGLLFKEGLLNIIVNVRFARLRRGKMPDPSCKYYMKYQNILFSLLNHFANIGFMNLSSALRYAVDPRKWVEHPLGGVPVTTLLHDIVTMSNSLPSFRETGYFDNSRLLIDDISMRDHLVGVKLLPNYGQMTDLQLLTALRNFSEQLPHMPEKVMRSFLNENYTFPDNIESWSLELKNLYLDLQAIALSFLYTKGETDQERLDRVWSAFRNYPGHDPDVLNDMRTEIELLLTKYDFINRPDRKKGLIDKVPWPLKDVNLARRERIIYNELVEKARASKVAAENRRLLEEAIEMASDRTFMGFIYRTLLRVFSGEPS